MSIPGSTRQAPCILADPPFAFLSQVPGPPNPHPSPPHRPLRCLTPPTTLCRAETPGELRTAERPGIIYGCSTVVLLCFTCPAITVATVILWALDRVRHADENKLVPGPESGPTTIYLPRIPGRQLSTCPGILGRENNRGGVLALSCSGADLRQPWIPRRARGPI